MDTNEECTTTIRETPDGDAILPNGCAALITHGDHFHLIAPVSRDKIDQKLLSFLAAVGSIYSHDPELVEDILSWWEAQQN